MSPSNEKNSIEDLKKALYSRSAPDVRTRRKLRYTDMTTNIKTSWEEPKIEVEESGLNQHYVDRSVSYLKKLLIGSIIFCVLAIGAGAYLFFKGGNLISADNISITVNGPVSIPGGTVVPFGVIVSNMNNVDLQLADMSVDFPVGTTNPTDSSKEMRNYRELLGDIPAGGSAEKKVEAIMFGEENSQKSIVVTVTYKVKGSSSIFTKNKSYDVLINSSPISMTVDAFKEVSSGQEFDMKVSLKSNSQETLKNIVVKAQYPFGFTFISADIKPLADNVTWKIGDIPAGFNRYITIHGKITGENNDARVFRFAVGAQSQVDPKNIGTQYVATEQDVTVRKPFISLAMSIDGNQANSDSVGSFDGNNKVEIYWVNNLPVAVSNMVITAKLSGSAYSKLSVQPQLGIFQSINDQIVWNQQTNPEFTSIGVGESGKVSFTISPKNLGQSSGQVINPQISISANVSANRTQETDVSNDVAIAVVRNIHIKSALSLSGKVVRTTGPFVNTGPIPPKVERTSTYTIIFDVDNTSNAIGNAQMVTTLPPTVKWLDKVSPSTENVTYDPNTSKITWQVGNIGTYTLNSQNRREVAFQVSVTPSVKGVGQPIQLTSISTLSGQDLFVGRALTSSLVKLTSRFSTDPTYKDGDGNVVK